jgi:hypothetical protein
MIKTALFDCDLVAHGFEKLSIISERIELHNNSTLNWISLFQSINKLRTGPKSLSNWKVPFERDSRKISSLTIELFLLTYNVSDTSKNQEKAKKARGLIS